MKAYHDSAIKIDAIFFDFDGVLTNNKVFVSEEGIESVLCSRADGLGFDVLRKLSIKYFIISTEKNKIVKARAKKIQAEVFYGISDKKTKLENIAKEYNLNLQRCIFLGNDINDLDSLKLCGISACPIDSHELVKNNVDIILDSKGGDGVLRELLESHLNIDCYKVLYE